MVSSRAETVGELVDTLCSRLGVGALPTVDAPTLLSEAEPHADSLIDWIDRETVPVAMIAYQRAKEMRSK